LAITQVPVTSSTRCLILGDDFLFTAIRKLGNETLQRKLQERINNTEKQPESKQRPHRKKTQDHDTKEKTVTASNGHFRVHFKRCRCPHCHQSSYPVIPIVGLDNAYTRDARRLIALLQDCNEDVRKVFQDAEAKLNSRLMERSFEFGS
jgi:hypothetical protein